MIKCVHYIKIGQKGKRKAKNFDFPDFFHRIRLAQVEKVSI